jgi:cytochrome b561
MKKGSWLKIINILLFIAFLGAAVGIILYQFGPESMRGSETVYQIHATSGIAFLILAVVHIVMNWKWIRNNILSGKKRG